MNDYKKYIESLAENRDEMIFHNSSPEHACIVMTTIFKTAKNSLRIFAGNLNGKVSNNSNYSLRKEYQEELIKFVEERQGNLSILLDEFDEGFLQTELYLKLHFYSILYSDRVQIKKRKTSVFNANTEKFHFTVGDSSIFRFESDTINYTAFGSFNNRDLSAKLIAFFDSNFNPRVAEPVAIA